MERSQQAEPVGGRSADEGGGDKSSELSVETLVAPRGTLLSQANAQGGNMSWDGNRNVLMKAQYSSFIWVICVCVSVCAEKVGSFLCLDLDFN